jgi:hypothetical protein
MYFTYLIAVLKRAFTATPRMTDALQILAASALPAVSTAFGVRLPNDAPTLVLAYIGMAALAFFVIRLFWAPYSIWREQGCDILDLRSELARPERLVMEHLAKHRAKARAKLAVELEKFQALGFREAGDDDKEDPDWHFTKAAQIMSRIRHLQAQAGLSEAFDKTRMRLVNAVLVEADTKNDDLPGDRLSQILMKLMQSHLIGELTAEALLLRSPPYTELERRR